MRSSDLVSRRAILGQAAAISAVLVTGFHTATSWAKSALKLIDMKAKQPAGAYAIAQGFKYIANGKKEKRIGTDGKAAPAKAGADGKMLAANKQFCNNCNYYKKVNANAGSCQLIAGVLVHDPGWCAMWITKQN